VNDILKQRLVGALILLALGVVFWPIIFVEPDGKKSAEQLIPAPPEVSTDELASPDETSLRGSPELAASSDSQGVDPAQAMPPEGVPASNEVAIAPPEPTAVQAAATPAPGDARSEPPQPLAMDSNGVPVAWTLQVATVSSAEKAENLRKQLLEMKQAVYVTTVRSGGKSLYRVCIGPKFERAALEKLQAGINAKFGVTSIIARYTP
jgi:DedD protein